MRAETTKPRKRKSITEDGDKLVTHAELRVLVEHISTLIAALDVRVGACESALPVDPAVKAEALAFVDANNRPGLVLEP